MASDKTIICPSCGFKNSAPLLNRRCVSCGALVEDAGGGAMLPEEHYQQERFNLLWFAISLGILTVLTGALVFGLPMVISALDFEGSAGMIVAIPVWCLSGVLVGLISPSKTFVEPVLATFLVAIPTVMYLSQTQTVKTMPFFMYVLMSALGVLFTLIGSYVGERIQMGPSQPSGGSND